MGSVLIFRGECFLDEKGSPTVKTLDAIRIYRQLAEELAQEYVVIPE